MGPCPPFLVWDYWESPNLRQSPDSRFVGSISSPRWKDSTTDSYTKNCNQSVGRPPAAFFSQEMAHLTPDLCVLAAFTARARFFRPAVQRCRACRMVEKLATENHEYPHPASAWLCSRPGTSLAVRRPQTQPGGLNQITEMAFSIALPLSTCARL